MREIRFRGKKLRDGEWTHGQLVAIEDSKRKRYFMKPEHTCIWRSDVFGGIFDCDPKELGGFHEVDPETIGQYVGLSDKHGRAIYEGDIIRITHHGENGTYAVRYYGDKDYPAFDTDPYYDYDYNGLSYATDMGAVEAIGNIYENPELLEAGDGP